MSDSEQGNVSEPLLTAVEVARILKVKPVTVHAAAADGRIPCVRVWQGKKRALVRFRKSDIRSLLSDGIAKVREA
jgi:excisionase family DNA binding protein